MTLTHAQLAQLIGRSRSLVTKYVQRGMPIGSAEEARAWFDAHIEPRAQYMRAAPGKTAAAAPPLSVQTSAFDVAPDAPALDAPDAPAGVPNDLAEYQAARAKREEYQAEMARLTLLERLGHLGSVEGFRRAASDMAQLTQDRILQVPGRIAPTLAAESDPIKIETLLTRELKNALEAVAQRAAEIAKPAAS